MDGEIGDEILVAFEPTTSSASLLTAFIAWQVFGRFVRNDTPACSETMSIQLMGCFIFLGAAVGIREGYHLSFDVLLYVVSDRAKGWMHTASDLVVIAIAVGIIVYGVQFVIGTWEATIQNIGLPSGVDYLSIIAVGVLMMIFSRERVALRLADLPTERFGETKLSADRWSSGSIRHLHCAASNRYAGRLLPRRRLVRDGCLARPSAARGVPAAQRRGRGLRADGDLVLHLRGRVDGAGRHRPPARGLRGAAVGISGAGSGKYTSRPPSSSAVSRAQSSPTLRPSAGCRFRRWRRGVTTPTARSPSPSFHRSSR